ncbi:hypothetical protein [Chitinophaga sp. XS-30]|uniref:hypothetical protein n=1 Tax=Chitinophaga sp. XS-30 TaxID=2604421 RepID=UPI0011DD1FAF|nr:hypothetical protein [Chitinophaga sp. XS-30]QEH39459.1 hypothetical protein FW415_00650 [Chitinophaga sp. XS-30]
MDSKIELLTRLGFSSEFLKHISEDFLEDIEALKARENFVFEELNVFPTEIVYPVIDKTQEPVNSYVNKS